MSSDIVFIVFTAVWQPVCKLHEQLSSHASTYLSKYFKFEVIVSCFFASNALKNYQWCELTDADESKLLHFYKIALLLFSLF